jgi:hypothetical protein
MQMRNLFCRLLLFLGGISTPFCAQLVNTHQAQPSITRAASRLMRHRMILASSTGALCNGVADDTSAIQAALNELTAYNYQVGKNVNATVVLPDGSCRITHTLIMGLYGSLIGDNNATILYADYSAWQGNNYDALDITINTQIPSEEAIANRKISGFSLFGKNSTTVVSTGIRVYSTAPTAGTVVTDQLPYLSFDHLLVSSFDTGIELDDVVASTIDTVNLSLVRCGVLISGNVVNVNMSHLQIQYSTPLQTSATKLSSIGVLVTLKTYANHGPDYPQGIILSDSDIVGFDYDLQVGFCEACNFHDNILDYGGDGPQQAGATVSIGLTYAVTLRANYIANNSANGVGIDVVNPLDVSQGSNNDNIWIEGNYITSYASNNTATGISFDVGTNPSRGVHIENNHFRNLMQGIAINHPVTFSSIRGNYGDQVANWLINLNGLSNQSLPGLLIQGNWDSDPIAVVNIGNATGFELEWNYSPIQTTEAPNRLQQH